MKMRTCGFKSIAWASPFANASGRALVNQARFAVSARRRRSLTHAAFAAFISGVRLCGGQFRIPTHAFPVDFAEIHKADPAPLIPTNGRG